MLIPDLAAWLGDICRDSDPYLEYIQLIIANIQKVYGDMYGKLDVAMCCMIHYTRGVNNLVCDYAN